MASPKRRRSDVRDNAVDMYIKWLRGGRPMPQHVREDIAQILEDDYFAFRRGPKRKLRYEKAGDALRTKSLRNDLDGRTENKRAEGVENPATDARQELADELGVSPEKLDHWINSRA